MNKKKLIPRDYPFFEPKIFYLYFLINNGKIVYIGETSDIKQRFKDHKKTRKYFLDKFKVKPYKKWTHFRVITSKSHKQVKKWEKRLIRFYSPMYNIGHNINSLYYTKVKKKNIKGKTYYYLDYIRDKKAIEPKYIKTKNGIEWTNYNPFKDRIFLKDNIYFVYNRFAPTLNGDKLRRIYNVYKSGTGWTEWKKFYNIRII